MVVEVWVKVQLEEFFISVVTITMASVNHEPPIDYVSRAIIGDFRIYFIRNTPPGISRPVLQRFRSLSELI